MARHTFPPLDPTVPCMLRLHGHYFCSVTVVPVRGGYALVLTLCPSSDDLYESVLHHHVFPQLAAAEAFRAKVQQRGTVDLRYWSWVPSRCSPYDFMQHTPANLTIAA